MLSQILAGLVGYLLGSFPTAYFLVKWKTNIDIRNAGSGNVGTLNSFEVTNSKFVGITVLLADLLKGVLAVLVVKWVAGDGFANVAIGGVAAVVGHNFPLWLGFKGGRGLATAAGVMLVLAWIFVPIWMAVWYIGKKLSGDVNVGNAIATAAILIVGLFAPLQLLGTLIPGSALADDFRFFIVGLVTVIFVRLVDPLKEYFSNRKS